MTGLWWSCKSCGELAYNNADAYRHRLDTGHHGHALATTECPPGTGSSKATRVAARAATAAAVDAARRKRTTVTEGEPDE